MQAENMEQTLVLIKPDAVKNSLTGYVLSMLSEFHTGLRFSGLKIVHVSKMLAEEHYSEHKGKPFFRFIIEYLMGLAHYPKEPAGQRIIAIVYQGAGAVKKVREVSGPTDPNAAREQKPGCIRSLGNIAQVKDEQGNVLGQRMDNLIHASANTADAQREIKLWFKPCDIPPLMRIYETIEAQDHYYYLNGNLFSSHEQGSICIAAPGDTLWKSDSEILGAFIKKSNCDASLESVVAKYLINE